MAESARMARRPKAADVVTNSADVARMKPPPRPMMAISSASPPRIKSTALGSALSPGGDDNRHHLGPHAIHRGRCQLARVPYQHHGKCGERERNDDAGAVDAPRRRPLRKVCHDLTRPTDFSTSVTRAFSFFRKSANASPER